MWPADTPTGQRVLNISLSSPFGQAHFEAPLTALAGFLLRTFQVIPAGREGEYINLDGELNQLLRRS